jgi:hypothetical protein
MVKEAQENTKLVLLPSQLVQRLRVLAIRRGVSMSSFASEALEQAVKAASLGVSIQEAVDLFHLMQVQKGAGSVQVNRESLDRLLGMLYAGSGDELRAIWYEAGRWYGWYLRVRLKEADFLDFLEKVLLVSWNLDEVEVREDSGGLRVRCTSFMMTVERTELLISYITGVLNSVGYEEEGRQHLKGMAVLKYRKTGGK